ncbi:MAG TPA: type IV toxin-antitoxin system AbiEi family antitoxin domain-containing protein [Gemmatimonadaceae bacterium]|jgi:predicted transcriptional regulator of viral defense system
MPTKRHTPSGRSAADRVLDLAKQRRILRARDLMDIGASRETLRRLERAGQIERRGRGLYVPAGAEFSEHEMLALASARVPHAVVCLLSALRFHGLTTQNPSEIWLALDRKARAPSSADLPLRIVRFSGAARAVGVERHVVDTVPVHVYSVAKTVADCFKYRQKIGIDVAVEALNDCWSSRRCSVDELWRYAAVCRVTNVMRPYLETVLARPIR